MPVKTDEADGGAGRDADGARELSPAELRERRESANVQTAPTERVRPDETAPIALERQLTTSTYDCVVIGGGIRIPPKSLLLFEVLVNTAHKCAPNASIAFNTRPEDTAEAAARWLNRK